LRPNALHYNKEVVDIIVSFAYGGAVTTLEFIMRQTGNVMARAEAKRKAVRREAALQAWRTRRANIAAKTKARSAAAHKAWETRRAKAANSIATL
jgi:ABC-type nitrate/sulfonate/bicarbonate transport system ATPase subunit